MRLPPRLVAVLALAVLPLPGTADADEAAQGHAWLAARVRSYNEARDATPLQAAADLVDACVDLERFAARAFAGFVEESVGEFEAHLTRAEYEHFVAFHQQRVLGALRERLVIDLAAWLTDNTRPGLELAAAEFGDRSGTVELLASGDAGTILCNVVLLDDGQWRLEDLSMDGARLSAHYARQHRRTLDERYSPAVLVAELAGRDYVRLEDFSASEAGGLPLGWRWRDRDENKKKPYRVRRQNGQYFLAAQDSGGSVILLRYDHWNPRRHPIMTWCWRAEALPPGGDERFGHTNDSVAGIYVLFSQNWIGMPRHIKYLWSTTLPLDTVDRRNRIARPWFVVAESGDEHLGEWLFEVADLERDYARSYGGRPKDRTQGLGLLTDANSTDSHAEAYYADLRVWTRAAYEAGRVVDYCDCYRELGPLTDTDGAASAVPTQIIP